MSVLCVLANKFPYGKIEAYMESEVSFYTLLEEVYICSLIYEKKTDVEIRKISDDIKVIPVNNGGKINRILWGLFALSDLNFYSEIKRLFLENRFSVRRLYHLINFMSRSHRDARFIIKRIGDDLKGKEVVFYSYRFEYHPYVAILLKKKLHLDDCKVVSRAHRYDLYEDRNPVKYIPLRYSILQEIDYVYPCSKHGEAYLKNKFPGFSEKIKASFLGTKDFGIENSNSRTENYLNIISCSNVVPIKRMDKIVEVIKRIPGYNIRWTHYGDGPLMEWLKSAVNDLPSNVSVLLKGNTSNDIIMENYKQQYYDFFINLSDSEGIPVSIMEAMSFGIPCVATDVGGTSEIVENGVNGLLLSPNTKAEEVATLISNNIQPLRHMRKACRETWNKRFNADKNYFEFFENLRTLPKGEKE